MVDLRGFGGSNGCLDWSGPGEQSDVVNAVQWAASQPWSTGKVGMYGKSYDALTGLVGVDHHPAGLDAVVSQEPVYDDYRYLYGDGMRRENSLATPALYDGIAATPGPIIDDPVYNAASLNDPVCLAQNFAAQAGNDNHDSAFWQQRNLIPGATGSDVPLFLTQGLTENNTVADGMQQYLDNHSGYERAWLGPWEHVRGNETCASGDSSTGCNDANVGRLKDGPGGLVRRGDALLRPLPQGPGAGRCRPADRRADQRRQVALGGAVAAGRHERLHHRSARGLLHRHGAVGRDRRPERLDRERPGVWTVSKPLPYDVHLAGSGSVDVHVSTTLPNANLVVDVYDLDAQRHRSAHHPAGAPRAQRRRVHDPARPVVGGLEARGRPPHRRARDRQQPRTGGRFARPSAQTVTVSGGSVTLPFLRYRRTETIEGDPGVQLDELPAVHRHGARWRAQRVGDRLHAAAGAGGRPGGVGVHRRLRRRALSPTGRAGSRACASRPA